MKRTVLVGLALLISSAAPAEEMKTPRISIAQVDWDAAAAKLAERPAGTTAEAFAKFNVTAEMGFPGIANSTVPVLLPFDVDGFRQRPCRQSRTVSGQTVRKCRSLHAIGISANEILPDRPRRL